MGNNFTYATPYGRVTLESDGKAITRLVPGEKTLSGARAPSALTNRAAGQLQEYLAGRRRVFDLPLNPVGTPFQLEVWQALERIPYGETRTYTQVAESIGRPRAARAVGGANNANPIPIIIPCHRVVPAAGGVGGYALGRKTKEFLLELERANAR